MTWTRHGHHIGGSPTSDELDNPHPNRARCGGPHLCKKCQEDEAVYRATVREPSVEEIKFPKPTTFRPVDGDVTAVQVTEDNAAELAEWSGGEVRSAGYSQKLAVVIPTLVAPEVVIVGDYIVKKGNKFSGMRKADFEKSFIHRPDLESVGQTSESVATDGTYLDIEDHIRRRAMENGTEKHWDDKSETANQYERSADAQERYFERNNQGRIIETDRAGNPLDSGPNGSWPPGYIPNKPRLG